MRVAGRPGWLVALFGLMVVLALALGGHALWRIGGIDRQAPGPVEGWMTPRYVVHAYDLVPGELAAALGVEAGSSPGETLEEIALRLGVPPEVLLARVQALVSAAAQGGGS